MADEDEEINTLIRNSRGQGKAGETCENAFCCYSEFLPLWF